MSDNIGQSNNQLKRLLKLIMAESDPCKFDELGREIWRALDEREELTENAQHPPEDPALAK